LRGNTHPDRSIVDTVLEEIYKRDSRSAVLQLPFDADGNSTQPADFLWPRVVTLKALTFAVQQSPMVGSHKSAPG
jgi:hypothetical protein